MKFVEITNITEYEKFLESSKKTHFLQSHSWGDFCKNNKNVIPHYVGVRNDKNNLIATALLLEKKLPFGYSYFYSPRGFILDYNDDKLLDFFTCELKEYAKKHKAIFIKIDPDIKLHDLTLDGQIVENENNNFRIVDYLKKLGYKHLGFNKAFENNQPRYTFRLDLSKGLNYIQSNFHNTTKKILNKGNLYGLEILKNDEKYINDFYTTMMETAKRESIALYSKEYYKNFYKVLHKENHSDIYIVYLDKNKTKKIINDNKDKLLSDLDKIKIETKRSEIKNQISKIDRLLEEIDEIKEDRLPLSSIITAKYADKVWTIHGGNHTHLRNLNSNYLIYYEIIKDAIDENYKTIDFFGTTFNPKESDPEYGIHLFKKRLGGEYTEFIGEFDLIIKNVIYRIFNILIPLYRKLAKLKNKVKK